MAHWDNFSDNKSALQLKANAIRRSEQEPGYGTTQMAIVMSEPVPSSARDIAVVLQGIGKEQSGSMGAAHISGQREAFTFKIRMLPEAGKKVSADAALPCTDSLAQSKNVQKAALRLSLLPDCIIKKGFDGEPPKVGDTIVIRTYKSDFGSATGLQTTEFVEIADPSLNFRQFSNPEIRLLEKQKIQNAFDSTIPRETIDSTVDDQVPENFYTTQWIPEIKIIGSQLVSPGVAAYLIDLLQYLEQSNSTIKILQVTNAYRTPQKQASIMMNYPGGDDALRGLYRRSGDRIEAFISAKNEGGLAAASNLVADYAARGLTFSKHQRALGVDLRSKEPHLTTDQVLELMAAIRATGGFPLFEPLKCSQGKAGQIPTERNCYNEHIHIGAPSSYAAYTQSDVDRMIALRNSGTANDDLGLVAAASGDADSVLAEAQNTETAEPLEEDET